MSRKNAISRVALSEVHRLEKSVQRGPNILWGRQVDHKDKGDIAMGKRDD